MIAVAPIAFTRMVSASWVKLLAVNCFTGGLLTTAGAGLLNAVYLAKLALLVLPQVGKPGLLYLLT